MGTITLLLLLMVAVTTWAVTTRNSSPREASTCFPGQENRNGLSVEALLDGATDFGLGLFSVLAREATYAERNTVLSPFSAWAALLLAYVGAQGPAERELQAVLGLGNATRADAARSYKALKYWYALRGDQRTNYTLHVANRMFVDKEVHLKACVEDYFAEELKRLDMVRAPEAARKTINAWIEERTRGRIRELFPPGSVNGGSPLALVNAAYFQGRWRTRFPANSTIPGATFRSTPTRQVQVNAMRLTSSFYHGRDDDVLRCEALELPFAGEELSALLLLPTDPNEKLDKLSNRLTAASLRRLRRRMSQKSVAAWIPRFRLEESVDLRPAVAAMGAPSLFDPSVADLGGFFEHSGDGKLSVGAVRHKAFLKLDENGGEAAAATGALAWRSARPMSLDDPVPFVADRPFIFLLNDNMSDAVLFAAAIHRPEDTPDQTKGR